MASRRAFTLHKQARVTAMAEDFLARRHLRDAPCRFDVVAVEFEPGAGLKVVVFQNAFDAVYR
jgi:Holliday junction resolvase-like predicted endonuclease